jgi:hypothetical protein
VCGLLSRQSRLRLVIVLCRDRRFLAFRAAASKLAMGCGGSSPAPTARLLRGSFQLAYACFNIFELDRVLSRELEMVQNQIGYGQC